MKLNPRLKMYDTRGLPLHRQPLILHSLSNWKHSWTRNIDYLHSISLKETAESILQWYASAQERAVKPKASNCPITTSSQICLAHERPFHPSGKLISEVYFSRPYATSMVVAPQALIIPLRPNGTYRASNSGTNGYLHRLLHHVAKVLHASLLPRPLRSY